MTLVDLKVDRSLDPDIDETGDFGAARGIDAIFQEIGLQSIAAKADIQNTASQTNLVEKYKAAIRRRLLDKEYITDVSIKVVNRTGDSVELEIQVNQNDPIFVSREL